MSNPSKVLDEQTLAKGWDAAIGRIWPSAWNEHVEQKAESGTAGCLSDHRI